MSLKHTLLGLIIMKPSTGYDLTKMIDQATSYLAPTTLRRVYPMLKKLANEGLVTFEIEPQTGRPDRKVYAVTEVGRAEFLSWLAEPAEEDRRSFAPFLLKLFFSGMLDREILLAHIETELALRRRQLANHQTGNYEPEVLNHIRPTSTPQNKAIFHTLHHHLGNVYTERVAFLENLKDALVEVENAG